jgi:hypothetical protein
MAEKAAKMIEERELEVKKLRAELEQTRAAAEADKKQAKDRADLLARIGLVLREHGWYSGGDYAATLSERIAASKAEIQVERTRAAQENTQRVLEYQGRRQLARDVAKAIGMLGFGSLDPAWPLEIDVVRVAREKTEAARSSHWFISPRQYQRSIDELTKANATLTQEIADGKSRLATEIKTRNYYAQRALDAEGKLDAVKKAAA